MEKIRLSLEYQCYPVWWTDPDKVSDFEPNLLPISPAVADAMMQWSDDYDSTIDPNDPAAYDENMAAESEAFQVRGLHLWWQLQHDLKNHYQVEFSRWGHSGRLQAFYLTRFEYFSLINVIMLDLPPLSYTTEQDLTLTQSDVIKINVDLKRKKIFQIEKKSGIDAINRDLRQILATLISPQRQILADFRHRTGENIQITIGIDGEAVAADVMDTTLGDHQLMDLAFTRDGAELLSWHTGPFPDLEEKTSSIRPISTVMEEAEIMVTLSILRPGDGNQFEASAAVSWIKTQNGLWWVDAELPKESAVSLSKEAFLSQLQHLLEAV